MRKVREISLRLVLVGVFVLAALVVPRLHVAHALHDADMPDLAAYAMPDGTLPELCLVSDGSGDGDHGDAPLHCFACRLVAAPGLLPQDAGWDHPLERVADSPWAPHIMPARAGLNWTPQSARAPPILLSIA